MAKKIPVSSVIANKFPNFVVEDYPKFAKFVELYYTFLKEQDLAGIGDSILTIRDVDSTLDKFVHLLWSEFGIYAPKTDIVNDKFFLKHIKEFYSTKGSEESFRMLFRHLFDTEIEIKYPKDYIFKTSDGEWVQDNSFLVDISAGDVYDIVGQQVIINTDKQSIPVSINRVRPIDNLFEVFFDKADTSVFSSGDILSFNEVVGSLAKTVTKTTIYKSGIGFFLGQIFTIPSVLGEDAKIKVTNIGVDGALLGIELINFGYGYEFEFYASISSNVSDDSVVSAFPTVESKTSGFIDRGYISKNDYCNDSYSERVYVGEILQEFYTDSTSTGNIVIDEGHISVVHVRVGAVRKYPGYYKSEKGFLSNSYMLQDSYYQTFSYVISTTKNIDDYKEIVKTLIHPTGMKMFGEQKLSNEIALISSLEILNRIFQVAVQDAVTVSESKQLSVGKRLTESLTASESYKSLLSKPVSETLTASESYISLLSKRLTESLTASESYISLLSKPVSETLTVSESYKSLLSKPVSETLTAPDSGYITTNTYCDISYCDISYCGSILQSF